MDTPNRVLSRLCENAYTLKENFAEAYDSFIKPICYSYLDRTYGILSIAMRATVKARTKYYLINYIESIVRCLYN